LPSVTGPGRGSADRLEPVGGAQSLQLCVLERYERLREFRLRSKSSAPAVTQDRPKMTG
jgi:hypothetical protein